MTTMHSNGEPISRGRIDRRAADARAVRNAAVGVALFGVVVVINGLLALLGIEALQALGAWPTPEATIEAP